MQSLLFGVAVLACPVGMGVMMWMMSRGRRGGGAAAVREQADKLRVEIDQLKADRAARSAQAGL